MIHRDSNSTQKCFVGQRRILHSLANDENQLTFSSSICSTHVIKRVRSDQVQAGKVAWLRDQCCSLTSSNPKSEQLWLTDTRALMPAMRSMAFQQQAFHHFKPIDAAIDGISHEIESQCSQRRKQQLRRVVHVRRRSCFPHRATSPLKASLFDRKTVRWLQILQMSDSLQSNAVSLR